MQRQLIHAIFLACITTRTSHKPQARNETYNFFNVHVSPGKLATVGCGCHYDQWCFKSVLTPPDLGGGGPARNDPTVSSIAASFTKHRINIVAASRGQSSA